jgi:hypothetical protein
MCWERKPIELGTDDVARAALRVLAAAGRLAALRLVPARFVATGRGAERRAVARPTFFFAGFRAAFERAAEDLRAGRRDLRVAMNAPPD